MDSDREAFHNNSPSITLREQKFSVIGNNDLDNQVPGEHYSNEVMQEKQFVNHQSQQQHKRPRVDLLPVVYITAHKIQQSLTTRTLTVLLDSGSSHTMMKRNSLPHGAIPTSTTSQRTTTTNGGFATNSTVTLHNVKFSEFGNQCIHQITADIFDSPTCQYDIILGRNILKLMGVLIDFQAHTINWMGQTINMKSRTQISLSDKDQYLENFYNHLEEEEDEDFDLLAELYADDIVIMDQKYQAVSPEEVVQQLDHLTIDQRLKLKSTFEKYKKVFDGTLGKHPTAKIDIQLIPNAKPIYQQPYPVSFK